MQQHWGTYLDRTPYHLLLFFNTAYTLLNIKYLLNGAGFRDNEYAYAGLLYYLFRTEFPFIINEAAFCEVFTLFLLEVES